MRPTIAVIEPGGLAKVPITSQSNAAQIQRDRFQVQVCILPKDMVNDESCESVSSSTLSLSNTNYTDLSAIFKVTQHISLNLLPPSQNNNNKWHEAQIHMCIHKILCCWKCWHKIYIFSFNHPHIIIVAVVVLDRDTFPSFSPLLFPSFQERLKSLFPHL